MKKTRSFLDNTYEFLSRRPVYHGLFWVLLFGLMRWIDQGNEVETWFALGNEFIQLLFYAVLVYVNLLYLIPNYLAKHAFVYFGLVLASCAIVTPIEVLVLYVKFAEQSDYRESLVAHQIWVFWGNVVVTGNFYCVARYHGLVAIPERKAGVENTDHPIRVAFFKKPNQPALPL
jgi:hypothetical protein